jgi:glutaredoxin/predicted NAD-dependent protein-ADP-ribosyltransferase YbiA (DUF1768 family)
MTAFISNENYDMLSAEYRYMDKAVSLSEYVLTSVISRMKPERLGRGNGNTSVAFKRLRDMNRLLYESQARSNLYFDADKFKNITPSIAREITKADYIKTFILTMYIQHHNLPNDSLTNMTMSEKNQLTSTLYLYYISDKFDKSFREIMEENELSQETSFIDDSGSRITISDYINMMVNDETNLITQIITDSVLKHRKFWINNIPGFANMIVTTDLSNLEVIEDGDVDVIEQVNLRVLKKIKTELIKKKGVTKPIVRNYVITLVRAFQELILEVSKINRGTKQVPSFLEINNFSCRLILSLLFPSCVGIFISPDSIPDYLTKFSTTQNLFENVDPEIFWIYFKFLHTYSDSELGNVINSEWKTDAKIKERLEEVSKMIYSRRINPNSLTNKQNLRLSIIKGDFVLYTKDGCSACVSAKKALRDAEIDFLSKVKDVNTIPRELRDILKSINYTTVPVLVVDGVFIGGNEELINILNTRQIRPNIQRIDLENENTIMDEESDDELYYDNEESDDDYSKKAMYAERDNLIHFSRRNKPVELYDDSSEENNLEEGESDDDSIDNDVLNLGTLLKNMNVKPKTSIADNTVAEKTSRDELDDEEPIRTDLYDDSTVFQFYSKSKDGPPPGQKFSKTGKMRAGDPGNGANERIAVGEIGTYKILEQNPNWRKMLSNFWGASFKLDGLKWASVEHYYQGSKFKRKNPNFYITFSQNPASTSELSTNPGMAKGAGGTTGKYRGTLIRGQNIKVDEDFFEGRGVEEMEKAMYAKFSQNDDLEAVLLDTKNAKLTHFSRGNPPVVFDDLMRVRERLRKENE